MDCSLTLSWEYILKNSKKAEIKIKEFLKKDNLSHKTHGLRVGVRSDGCSGKSYVMELKPITECKELGDKIFEKNGSTIMIERLSYMFVIGSRLEYIEALTGSGFQLINPNIKGSCACGSSFAV